MRDQPIAEDVMRNSRIPWHLTAKRLMVDAAVLMSMVLFWLKVPHRIDLLRSLPYEIKKGLVIKIVITLFKDNTKYN